MCQFPVTAEISTDTNNFIFLKKLKLLDAGIIKCRERNKAGFRNSPLALYAIHSKFDTKLKGPMSPPEKNYSKTLRNSENILKINSFLMEKDFPNMRRFVKQFPTI